MAQAPKGKQKAPPESDTDTDGKGIDTPSDTDTDETGIDTPSESDTDKRTTSTQRTKTNPKPAQKNKKNSSSSEGDLTPAPSDDSTLDGDTESDAGPSRPPTPPSGPHNKKAEGVKKPGKFMENLPTKEEDSENTSSPESEPGRSPPKAKDRAPTSPSDRGRSTKRSSREGSSKRPTNPSDPEKGQYDKEYTGQLGGDDCCSCSSCEGRADCWRGFLEWRIWSWLRQQSAFIIGFLAASGMAGAGVTGIMDWWIFVSLNGTDLGGIGYCERGSCTIQPLYQVDVGRSDFFATTQVLSGLLLVASGVGGITLGLLFYLFMSAFCGDGTFQPPHKRFLCCSRFSTTNWEPSEREVRRACTDNAIAPARWEDDREVSASDKTRMLNESRRKDCFQMYMFWFFWPTSIVLVGLLWLWSDTANAEEKFGFQVTVWGGMAMLLFYAVAVNIYRPTREGVTRQAMSRQYDDASSKARYLRAEAKATGSSLKEKAGDLRERAGSAASKARKNLTPNRAPPRRNRRG